MSTVELNKPIGPFESLASSDMTVTNESLMGKKTIFYFYPKDNTPGCTQESQGFRDAYADFQALNTQIFGISRDSLRTHENFKKKHEFPFELISDPEETLCRLFDVMKLKKLYGRESIGIERSTFIVDEQGVLIKEWRKVKVKGHVQEVLETLTEL